MKIISRAELDVLGGLVPYFHLWCNLFLIFMALLDGVFGNCLSGSESLETGQALPIWVDVLDCQAMFSD